MVVGVPDDEYGERVAAAVVLKSAAEMPSNTHVNIADVVPIAQLRNDLRHRLAGYKLPTVLRIIKDELPKSPTGKVVKKTLSPQYFPGNYRDIPEVQLWSPGIKLKL